MIQPLDLRLKEILISKSQESTIRKESVDINAIKRRHMDAMKKAPVRCVYIRKYVVCKEANKKD